MTTTVAAAGVWRKYWYGPGQGVVIAGSKSARGEGVGIDVLAGRSAQGAGEGFGGQAAVVGEGEGRVNLAEDLALFRIRRDEDRLGGNDAGSIVYKGNKVV